MAAERSADGGSGIFRSKRTATRHRILLRIIEYQPAIDQKEIAQSVDLTPQAISEHLQDLETCGHVQKHGRGRYEVIKRGADRLISQTNELQTLVEYVNREILGGMEVETAVAAESIEDGEPVSLSVQGGRLRARPGEIGTATAIAMGNADRGREVGVTNFEGVLDYDPGTVKVVTVPEVQHGGCDEVATDRIAARAERRDRVAVVGMEAAVAARLAGLDTDIAFGVPTAVTQAAMKGLDVLVLAIDDERTPLVESLRQEGIEYNTIDGTEL
jgi:putative transcriptional regulator